MSPRQGSTRENGAHSKWMEFQRFTNGMVVGEIGSQIVHGGFPVGLSQCCVEFLLSQVSIQVLNDGSGPILPHGARKWHWPGLVQAQFDSVFHGISFHMGSTVERVELVGVGNLCFCSKAKRHGKDGPIREVVNHTEGQQRQDDSGHAVCVHGGKEVDSIREHDRFMRTLDVLVITATTWLNCSTTLHLVVSDHTAGATCRQFLVSIFE